MAHARTSVGGGASVGAGAGAGTSSGGVSGGASGGVIGGGSVVTPPASAGGRIGRRWRCSTSQPAIDTNQAQQPGIGVNSGASNNASDPLDTSAWAGRDRSRPASACRACGAM
jgi:hypothetical protein